MTNITHDTLAAIRAACEAATPGEWNAKITAVKNTQRGVVMCGQKNSVVEIARRHLLPLCDEVERLRAELARLEPRASTHYNGCWKSGPAHYECAVRHYEELARLYEIQREVVLEMRGALKEMTDVGQRILGRMHWMQADDTLDLLESIGRAQRALDGRKNQTTGEPV